jgi:hypothetical protein
MSGEGAVIIHVLQKKIIRKFRDQCATDPRQAVSLESLRIRKSLAGRRLIQAKVLAEAGEGRYYLDEDAAERFFKKKRRAAVLALIIIAISLIVMMLLK